VVYFSYCTPWSAAPNPQPKARKLYETQHMGNKNMKYKAWDQSCVDKVAVFILLVPLLKLLWFSIYSFKTTLVQNILSIGTPCRLTNNCKLAGSEAVSGP
jgi:hypothetical protein